MNGIEVDVTHMGEEEQSAKEAIRLLFDEYSGDVYRYARIMLGNEADARDVVQEVFFRAFRAWHGFRKESTPKTWLMTITRHCVFTLYGKRKRESNFLANCDPPYTRDEAVDPETILAVEEALSRLKTEYRQVIVLRHIEGFSVQESARILGWSESKVTTTHQRAIKRLRDLLTIRSEEVTAN